MTPQASSILPPPPSPQAARRGRWPRLRHHRPVLDYDPKAGRTDRFGRCGRLLCMNTRFAPAWLLETHAHADFHLSVAPLPQRCTRRRCGLCRRRRPEWCSPPFTTRMHKADGPVSLTSCRPDQVFHWQSQCATARARSHAGQLHYQIGGRGVQRHLFMPDVASVCDLPCAPASPPASSRRPLSFARKRGCSCTMTTFTKKRYCNSK
jgi:hypothetical protein